MTYALFFTSGFAFGCLLIMGIFELISSRMSRDREG